MEDKGRQIADEHIYVLTKLQSFAKMKYVVELLTYPYNWGRHGHLALDRSLRFLMFIQLKFLTINGLIDHCIL